jgi:hypothetical protein
VVAEAACSSSRTRFGVLGERVVVRPHGTRGDLVAHTELEDHLAGELGDSLEVVAAPFVTAPKTICSAARPESSTFIRSRSSSFVWR